MENSPEAATSAPAEATVATPNTNPEPIQAPEINAEQVAKYLGTNTETLSKFQRFVESNGRFDTAFSKMKTSISSPQSVPAPQPAPEPAQPAQAPAPSPEPYTPPQGSITANEFLAQQYFKALSTEEKYAPIAKGIASGEYLKEMSAFGISPLNQDGSLNDQKIRMYLDLKAQTVPAIPTGTEPNASPAPTVEYVPVAEGGITSMDQAYAVLDQDMRLKAAGQPGHPNIQMAEDYIRSGGKPTKK